MDEMLVVCQLTRFVVRSSRISSFKFFHEIS
jgi:hypothetical protein